MKKSRIDLISRQDIYQMRERGKSLREIANATGYHYSSISRELMRNGPRERREARAAAWVQAKVAQERADKRKSRPRPRQRLKSVEIQDVVVELIRPTVHKLSDGRTLTLPGLSPKQIAAEVPKRLPGKSISHEAIYQWIFLEARELIPYLERLGAYRRRRKRTEKVGRRRLRRGATPKKHILQRTVLAERREEFGHRERDTVVSSRGGKAALLNILERKSRYMNLSRIGNLEAETGQIATIRALRNEPRGSVRSIANDHGSENLKWEAIEKVLGTEVFFCSPYAAYQRGSDERANRTLRRVYPKGTNFDDVSDEEMPLVQDWYNNRPLGVLGYRTPREVYEAELARLGEAA